MSVEPESFHPLAPGGFIPLQVDLPVVKLVVGLGQSCSVSLLSERLNGSHGRHVGVRKIGQHFDKRGRPGLRFHGGSTIGRVGY